jgi:LPS export ABC transporter protein LptC
MRRSRLRAGLLVVVAMALTGIGYRVWRNVAERTPRSLGELGVELIPEVAQHMQNFHRIKVKNGHTEWDIKADDAQYYQKQNEIVVRLPEVTIYTEQGQMRAWLTGKEAHLGLVDEGREVGSMEIRGDVILWLDDLELRTGTATYDRDRDLITAPGAVTITGRTMNVNAEGMEVDVTPQRIRLLENVHTLLKPNAEGS